MAAAHRLHQRREIDDAGAAEQDEGRALAHLGEGVGAEKALVLAGHRRDDEDEVAVCQHLRRGSPARRHCRRGSMAAAMDRRRGSSPGSPTSSRFSARPRSPKPMMPISDAGQQPRRLVAVAAPQLRTVAEGEVGIDDVARQVERHGEAELGDRLGKHRAGRHDMDAALEQQVVGHVVEQVGLDVEDAAAALSCARASRATAAAGRRCSGPAASSLAGSAAIVSGSASTMRYFARKRSSAAGVKIRSSVRGSGALMTSGLAASGMMFPPDGL